MAQPDRPGKHCTCCPLLYRAMPAARGADGLTPSWSSQPVVPASRSWCYLHHAVAEPTSPQQSHLGACSSSPELLKSSRRSKPLHFVSAWHQKKSNLVPQSQSLGCEGTLRKPATHQRVDISAGLSHAKPQQSPSLASLKAWLAYCSLSLS